MSNDERECWRNGAPHDGAVDLDVSWLVPADLNAVDALARLHLAAIRCGRWVRLHGVEGGLAELIEFAGLSDVVQLCPHCGSAQPLTSGHGHEREAEQLEQRRVQEHVDGADAPVDVLEHLDCERRRPTSRCRRPVDGDGR